MVSSVPRSRSPTNMSTAGETVVLLGETREELSGSEWAHVVHGHLGGRPPALSLEGEKALAALLHEAVGLISSAHDLSDGGLAQALVEAVESTGLGGNQREEFVLFERDFVARQAANACFGPLQVREHRHLWRAAVRHLLIGQLENFALRLVILAGVREVQPQDIDPRF